jgi:hypothetical protein
MHASGAVKGSQKISATSGNFGVGMWDNGRCGASVAGLGDLDGDLVADIAMGCEFAETFLAAGAVWILFLNTDGTVKRKSLIDSTTGFPIGTDFYFGYDVVNLGDVDGGLLCRFGSCPLF